jgi:protein-S-isoprenylcysteine O-methyltransferase Ste14
MFSVILVSGEILSTHGINKAGFLLFWAVITGLQLTRARIEEKKLCRALSDYQAYQNKTPFIFSVF